MWTSKDVYYVSGSTALLAEDMGQALLCQFQEISFHEEKLPFIKTRAEAEKALTTSWSNPAAEGPLSSAPSSTARSEKSSIRRRLNFLTCSAASWTSWKSAWNQRPLRVPGSSRAIDDMTLAKRVEAIHFSIEHDDGTRTREYDEAEVILLGVSRSGKTPVSVYLATHMGIKAANFPLTTDDLNSYELPPEIVRNRKKVVGLTSSPQLLHKIREQRYSGSSYASIANCANELNLAKQIFLKYSIPVVSTDGKSIEEISVQVTQLVDIPKKQWRSIL
jgi:[pyruvate, water dikinase]-phosphate phosphotransferase / [pyruvate, water dikinase] kinase